MSAHKKGISSLQLAKDLGITQKTGWFILQRIRQAMKTRSTFKSLTDTVKCDETFIGGKNKNRHLNKKVKFSQGRSIKDKVPVFGLFQRNGKLISKPVKDTSKETLQTEINFNVAKGTNVITDEWLGYRGLSKDYNHSVVNLGNKEYVNRIIHTNTIEGFWSF